MTRIFYSAVLMTASLLIQTAKADYVNGPTWNGTEVACDMPMSQYQENSVGTDNSGLCVFTSITHSARYQNIEVLKNFRDYMENHPGGGYPSKVDKFIKRICDEKGVPVPDYFHVEGKASDVCPVIEQALKTNRNVCITWGTDDARYKGRPIAHMINCVYLDHEKACVLDNNYPKEYLWCTRAQFEKRVSMGGAWIIVFLKSGPPLPPKNLS